MEGVARLRISNDIEFEEETFIDMMRAAKEVNAFNFCSLFLNLLDDTIPYYLHCNGILETMTEIISWRLRESR